MSSFTDPSSIVLIVGAVFIFLFIMHGLWFSGKPQNRRLKKNNKRDQELSRSEHVGKVRIVTADTPSNDERTEEVDIDQIKVTNNKSGHTRHMPLPNDYDYGIGSLENNASVSVNNIKRASAEAGIEEVNLNKTAQQAQGNSQGRTPPRSVYEIILSAEQGRPYNGEDIEELCNQYGFIQGFIKDNLKIYFVYENASTKENEVFRICSMEAPYYFPENMQDYQTSAIALYMSLPPKGKGFAYFKALRMATEIFIGRLGGRIEDQHRRPLEASHLDAIAAELQIYDEGLSNIGN